MNKKEYSKTIENIIKAMLLAIEANYLLNVTLIEPKYAENGSLINKTDINEQNKEIKKAISAIWLANSNVMKEANKQVIDTNFIYYNAVKERLGKPVYTRTEINAMINDIVKVRSDAVKIKQVISGNANVFNNRLQKQIKEMYIDGATKKDIQKAIKKQFGLNTRRAKTIATTEVNYYKSSAQLEATKGLAVKKIWRHKRAREPRETHVAADGQVVYGHDAMFVVGGKETIAPQHFGIASEDINCHCEIEIILLEKGATQVG